MISLFAEVNDRQLRQAIGAARLLAENASCTQSFIGGALEQLPALVPSDLTTLSVCDLKKGSRQVFGRQAEALSQADRAIFDHYFSDHPLVRFHGSHPFGPTQRISDCIARSAFKDSALYSDYYIRLGINYVMALPLRIDRDTVVSIVLNRSQADFTSAERGALEIIRPQLAAVYRNLLAREEANIAFESLRNLAAASGWHVIRVDGSGVILDAASSAFRLLRRYFTSKGAYPRRTLPEVLVPWLSRCRNWGFDRPAESGEPFCVSRFGVRLTIHFVLDPAAWNCGYLLMKETRLSLGAECLRTLPLTAREREVLALVTAGKSNPEIGLLLDISPRTVQKHLEHVFEKLGVETRTAAALRALSAVTNETESV